MGWIPIAELKGDKGDKGDTGDQGVQGLPGTGAVPADSAVAGYLSTLGTSATQQAADARYIRGVHVESFGAVGDGVTDDRAAIQAAIAAAGKMPVILSKRYLLNAPIVTTADGQTILGAGGTLVAGSAFLWHIRTLHENTTIRGVHFEGGEVGVYFGEMEPSGLPTGNTAHGGVVDGCSATNLGYLAEFRYSSRFRVTNNVSLDSTGGLVMWWGGDANPTKPSYPGEGVYNIDGGLVSGNICVGAQTPSGALFGSKAMSPAWGGCAKNIKVSGNYFENFYDVGIDFEASTRCTAVDNTLVDCFNAPLATFFNTTDCLFADNHCVGTARLLAIDPAFPATAHDAPKRLGFWLTAQAAGKNAEGIVFRGNTFDFKAAPGAGGALASDGPSERIYLEQNLFIGGEVLLDSSQKSGARSNRVINGGIRFLGCNEAHVVDNDVTIGTDSPSLALAVAALTDALNGRAAVVTGNIIRKPAGVTSGAYGGVAIKNTAPTLKAVGAIVANNVMVEAVFLENTDATTVQQNNIVKA